MSVRLNEFLEILMDGRWHTLKEISETIQLPEEKTEKIATFFEKYDFIQFDIIGKKVKIRPEIKDFLQKETH